MSVSVDQVGRRRAVVLRHVAAQPSVLVPELWGAVELAVADDSTASAIVVADLLLARAASDPSTDAQPDVPAAVDLTAADRDRVLVGTYRATFGDLVEASPDCSACGSRYDLDFSLGELAERIDSSLDEPAATDAPLETARAVTLRLPLGRDELAVSALEPHERPGALLDRCLGDHVDHDEHDADALLEEVEAILAAVAPTVDHELTAACPECDTTQAVRFDVQSYLLGLLVAGRDRVLRDVHLLASSYGWAADAILSLPRRDRARLARLVEWDAAAGGGRR